METKRIKVSELEPNLGQIDGLPINPRQWTKTDVDNIAASLKETPELFEARPLIVTPHAGKYIILGGNLRFEGVKKNKDKDAPCIIVPEDTPIGKLKEIVIKDNGSFGAWDYDALANEWDDLPLQDWGVPSWNPDEDNDTPAVSPDDFGTEFSLPDGEKSNFCTMSFQVSSEQRDAITSALEEMKKSEAYQCMETYGNENSNGNALALLVLLWEDAKK